MNITPSAIYWITRLDAFSNLCILPIIIGMVGVILSIVHLFVLSDTYNTYTMCKKQVVYSIYMCLFSVFLFITGVIGRCLIPTTREMCAIYIIPKIANNEHIGELGNALLTKATEWVNELGKSN